MSIPGMWIDVLLSCTPGIDPGAVEINVLLDHFRDSGLKAIEYKRVTGVRAEFIALNGFFIYKVRVEDGNETDTGV